MPSLRQFGTRARLLLRGLRYKALLPYAGIDGELSVDEAIALYEVCGALPPRQPVAVVLGCAQGRTSVVLGKGLQQGRNATIYCVDPFDQRGAFDRQQRTQFVRNLVTAGVRNLVDVLQGRSSDIVLEFRRPIDLLLLDGEPAAETLLRDFRDWAPKVRPGGFLCAHTADSGRHRDSRRAIESVALRDGCWTDGHFVDGLFIARRQGGAAGS